MLSPNTARAIAHKHTYPRIGIGNPLTFGIFETRVQFPLLGNPIPIFP